MNPIEELEMLESLVDELIEGLQAALASGEELSDEFQGALAEELAITEERITQLRAEIDETMPHEPEAPTTAMGEAPTPAAQLLWILAGQQEEAFLNYLSQFPSEETQALLNNPTELNRVLGFLNRMMPPGQQPVVDGIQHSDLNSSNIWGSKYDPKTGMMTVRFQGGSEYEYDGVPENIYRAFEAGNATAKTDGRNRYGVWFRGKNPSMGAALNQYIKQGNFPYRKIK